MGLLLPVTGVGSSSACKAGGKIVKSHGKMTESCSSCSVFLPPHSLFFPSSHPPPSLKISVKEAFAVSGWRPGLFLGCPELAMRMFKWVYYGSIIFLKPDACCSCPCSGSQTSSVAQGEMNLLKRLIKVFF